MQYGMYISASAVSAAMARQDVISNNLANVNTVGFRPDSLDLRQRDAVSIEDGLPSIPSNKLLERLGGGVFPIGTRVGTGQGPLQETRNQLDLALEGDGFFVTRSPHGPAGEGDDGTRLTRDGRMTTRADGALVLAATGTPMLSVSGSEVRVNLSSNERIHIDAYGVVRQGNTELGKLAVANVAQPSRLVKEGENLLRPFEQTIIDGTAHIRSGHIEMSSVDAIKAMMGVTSASNAASGGLTMISYYSDMMSRAISSLGRVA